MKRDGQWKATSVALAAAGDGPSDGSRRLNCWECTGCGRETGGSRVADLGVCPAAVDRRLDGVHGGKNAGRCCWVVAGTFCEGKVQGTFARKLDSCKRCEFFQRVQREEGQSAEQANTLLSYLSSSEAAERRRYHQLLCSMVDSSVVPLALGDLDALKRGEEKHITAFFSDIVSSSAITQRLEGSQLAAFLNEYFSAVTEVLKAEGGTIDKYVGDGMVGIFGAPLQLENDARAAARAALRMLRRVDRLRDEWRWRRAWCPEVWSLRIRIGLNSGCATVGFFGTRNLASYTMSGPTVNVAKRLEQACRHYGVSILVGEATRDLLADEMLLRRLDRIRLNGRGEAVYELLGEKRSVAASLLRATEVFEAALELYDSRQWAEAASLFRQALELRGEDLTARRLLHRCEQRRAAARMGFA